jgi:hypothetical protein
LVCNPPYMRLGSGCCLDRDNNRICDADETTTTLPTTTTSTHTTSTTSTTMLTTTTLPPTTVTTTMPSTSTTSTTTSTTESTLPPTTIFIPCTDTDAGEDVYVKGVAARGFEKGTDRCVNTAMIREFYCMNNHVTSKSHQCPLGCSDGRCLGCEDTDGGDNPNVYGEVTLGSTLHKKDICSNRDGVTLTEFYCQSHEEIGSRQVVCPTSCDGGYCH